MTMRQDLSRDVLLHCCKDGTITFRERGEPIFNGVALPFFSVDTREDAKLLQVTCCSKQYAEHPLMPGRPWYVDHTFEGELEDLERMTDRYRAVYERLQRARSEGEAA